MKKKAMSAQFTPVNEMDFANFFRRGFGALRPVRGASSGEIFYDLTLGPEVRVRIFTTLRANSGEGAGHGEDAIRTTLTTPTGKPLVTNNGKWFRSKRTQNWRDNLRAQIGEMVEKYEENPAYWEDRSANWRLV